jgi:hypothetical protein
VVWKALDWNPPIQDSNRFQPLSKAWGWSSPPWAPLASGAYTPVEYRSESCAKGGGGSATNLRPLEAVMERPRLGL